MGRSLSGLVRLAVDTRPTFRKTALNKGAVQRMAQTSRSHRDPLRAPWGVAMHALWMETTFRDTDLNGA